MWLDLQICLSMEYNSFVVDASLLSTICLNSRFSIHFPISNESNLAFLLKNYCHRYDNESLIQKRRSRANMEVAAKGVRDKGRHRNEAKSHRGSDNDMKEGKLLIDTLHLVVESCVVSSTELRFDVVEALREYEPFSILQESHVIRGLEFYSKNPTRIPHNKYGRRYETADVHPHSLQIQHLWSYAVKLVNYLQEGFAAAQLSFVARFSEFPAEYLTQIWETHNKLMTFRIEKVDVYSDLGIPTLNLCYFWESFKTESERKNNGRRHHYGHAVNDDDNHLQTLRISEAEIAAAVIRAEGEWEEENESGENVKEEEEEKEDLPPFSHYDIDIRKGKYFTDSGLYCDIHVKEVDTVMTPPKTPAPDIGRVLRRFSPSLPPPPPSLPPPLILPQNYIHTVIYDKDRKSIESGRIPRTYLGIFYRFVKRFMAKHREKDQRSTPDVKPAAIPEVRPAANPEEAGPQKIMRSDSTDHKPDMNLADNPTPATPAIIHQPHPTPTRKEIKSIPRHHFTDCEKKILLRLTPTHRSSLLSTLRFEYTLTLLASFNLIIIIAAGAAAATSSSQVRKRFKIVLRRLCALCQLINTRLQARYLADESHSQQDKERTPLLGALKYHFPSVLISLRQIPILHFRSNTDGTSYQTVCHLGHSIFHSSPISSTLHGHTKFDEENRFYHLFKASLTIPPFLPNYKIFLHHHDSNGTNSEEERPSELYANPLHAYYGQHLDFGLPFVIETHLNDQKLLEKCLRQFHQAFLESTDYSDDDGLFIKYIILLTPNNQVHVNPERLRSTPKKKYTGRGRPPKKHRGPHPTNAPTPNNSRYPNFATPLLYQIGNTGEFFTVIETITFEVKEYHYNLGNRPFKMMTLEPIFVHGEEPKSGQGSHADEPILNTPQS